MTTYEVLPETTRVWIYQSNRVFTDEEILLLDQQLSRFAEQWVSHSQQLRAFAKLYHQRFIVLMVDESMAGASGCSIDTSVNFIKGLEGHFSVDLFDRMTFAYLEDAAVKTVSKDAFANLYATGKINDDTLVFDNLVKTKGDFSASWQKRLGDSWHKRFV